MADLAERARKIIIETLDADPCKVVDDARFIEELGADSLDYFDLILSLEEEFDVEIPDAAAEDATTVGKAITALRKLVEA